MPGFVCVGGRDAQLGQAAVQPRHVLFKAKQAAAVDRHDLVDTIAEDEATVHDADLGVAQRCVVAVEVAGKVGQGMHGGKGEAKFVILDRSCEQTAPGFRQPWVCDLR